MLRNRLWALTLALTKHLNWQLVRPKRLDRLLVIAINDVDSVIALVVDDSCKCYLLTIRVKP